MNDTQILTELFVKLTSKSVDALKNHPRIHETSDPNDFFAYRPPDAPLLLAGKITEKALDAFSSFSDQSETQDQILALYDILISDQIRTIDERDYINKIRALEYAIWDAKYRFEEISIKYIENFYKAAKICNIAPLTTIDKLNIIKVIKKIFSANRRNRGINTHNQQLRVATIEEISFVSLFRIADSLNAPSTSQDFTPQLEEEMEDKIMNFKEQKKEEQKNFKRLSDAIILECQHYAVDDCKIEEIVDAALLEPLGNR